MSSTPPPLIPLMVPDKDNEAAFLFFACSAALTAYRLAHPPAQPAPSVAEAIEQPPTRSHESVALLNSTRFRGAT